MHQTRLPMLQHLAALLSRFLLLVLVLLSYSGGPQARAGEVSPKPNIIFIFADDLGYADVGCYGAQGFKTPNLDQMAKEGLRFTSFYTGCPVCSGSRASLLTGRHYQRVGLPAVMFPGNRNGIDAREITIATLLRRLGYATGIIGKWHLGHLPQFLPTRNGFDYYYGIPYSNDMTIDPANAKLARDVLLREGMTVEKINSEKPKNGKVPLMRGEEVIEYPADLATLTRRYTEEAEKFIQAHKDRSFFLYIPHTMPHVPLAATKEFKERTKTLFGAVMEELDWSVGRVLQAVKDNGLDSKTLVIFTSDNGAHQGSALPLRAKKASEYEGGVRVPCIARWPGKVPANATTDAVTATIDMLPTFAKLAGGEAPKDRPIDGKDIRPLLLGEKGAKSPHEFYILLHNKGSVRSGQWKFYPWPEGAGGKKGAKNPPPKGPKVQLYDLVQDISEKKNVAEAHPEVVTRLAGAYEKFAGEVKKVKAKKKTEPTSFVEEQDGEKSALEREPKGWLDLLPGKDLQGWKRVPLDAKLSDKNPWQVKGKVLQCDGVGSKEMLLHEKAFADGIFHVEWRFRKVEGKTDYNSGVYVRSASDGKVWHQVQVAHLQKPPLLGDIFGDTLVKGKVERVVIRGEGTKRANPPGEWNTFEITTRGKTVSVWINGATTCTWNDCPLLKGHVGVQAEFFFIEFRNLKFKPLK